MIPQRERYSPRYPQVQPWETFRGFSKPTKTATRGFRPTSWEGRPDIAEAERQMAVANAQIGVATAGYRPSLNMVGQGRWNSMNVSQLFNPASGFWALLASLIQTIFDGGARTEQVNFTQAGYAAAVASYRATVLSAIREVQDSITGLQVLDAARQSQAEAVASSRHQLGLANSRYVGGLVSYLNNEQEAAVIQGRRLVTSVLLVKALGGGRNAASLAAVQAKPRVTDAFTP